MREVADSVVAFMDSAKIDRAHLCGFHTGGKVAAAVAAFWPARSDSLTICGKSHSIIPDHAQRNKAMRDQVASRKPDVALIAMENFVADDAERAAGVARVYDANFAFDLAGAVARVECPVMVVEITSADEDIAHGRQADALAGCARHGKSMALPEIETMGVDLYVGASHLADVLNAFIEASSFRDRPRAP